MTRLALLVAVLGSACGPDSSAGDCSDTLLAGDLVITEVFADAKAPPGGSGTDEGKEWFEIYNNTERPVELKGITLTHSRPDGSRAKSHTMTAVTIAPGQYFTLGNSAEDLLPAYIDYGFGADLGDFFNTDGGQLKIACGSSEIDSAIYESVKEGRSRQLTSAQPPDYQLNDVATNWCEADATEFEEANFGTPGSDNDCTPIVVGQCNDAGTMRDAVPPTIGDIVITEALPNPAVVSDTDAEWFEVYAVNAVDLNGVLLDRAGDTANPRAIESPDCVHLDAGSYGIFVKNTDTALNGGLPAASIKGTFTFSLVDGTVAAPGDVRLLLGTDVLDAIAWTSSVDGSSVQLDPDRLDPTANDDESNFCAATTAYSADNNGTPGSANMQCAAQAGPGECLDNGTPRAIVKPTAGNLVITEFLANPAGTGTDNTQEWFEIQNIGATSFDLNGLGVKGNGATPFVIAINDCKPVAAGAYALLAHNADPMQNGMLPEVDATFPTSVAIAASNGSLTILDGATVLDAITWTTMIVEGSSKQLKPGAATTTTTANDLYPDNWCNALASQVYGSAANLGTPKDDNVCQ
ncbi:MAG: lamin tail domain-containing protein [Kofleriaceae bacterium]